MELKNLFIKYGMKSIIEAVKLGSPEAMVAFCKGIQAAAPVDSFVSPEPWEMPGVLTCPSLSAGICRGGALSCVAAADLTGPVSAGLRAVHHSWSVSHYKVCIVNNILNLKSEKTSALGRFFYVGASLLK